MRLPFPSLRANLIAAFVAVIAVSLLLASGTFAYLLREYQVQREYDRLESVAEIYMMQVVRMARTGASLQAISTQLDQSAGDAGVRVLLLDDRGDVLHDTDNNRYTGRTFSQAPNPGRHPNVSRSIESGTVLTVASMPDPRVGAASNIAVPPPSNTGARARPSSLPRLPRARRA